MSNLSVIVSLCNSHGTPLLNKDHTGPVLHMVSYLKHFCNDAMLSIVGDGRLLDGVTAEYLGPALITRKSTRTLRLGFSHHQQHLQTLWHRPRPLGTCFVLPISRIALLSCFKSASSTSTSTACQSPRRSPLWGVVDLTSVSTHLRHHLFPYPPLHKYGDLRLDHDKSFKQISCS